MSTPDHLPVVYYLSSAPGSPIKIGTTINLERRLQRFRYHHPGWPPLTYLAIERGNVQREGERHREFAAARLQGEWFWPTDRLLSLVTYLDHPREQLLQLGTDGEALTRRLIKMGAIA